MREIVGFPWIVCDLRLSLVLSRQPLTTFWAKITSDYRKSEILEIGFPKAGMNMSILPWSNLSGETFFMSIPDIQVETLRQKTTLRILG